MVGSKRKKDKDFELFAKIGKIVVFTFINEGLISERLIRDMLIREEYNKMIESGIKSKEARKILAGKSFVTSKGEHYYIGEKNIEKIIYSKR